MSAQQPRRGPQASRQLALLEELKAAAQRLGFAVREERLLRDVGYHVRSGRCRLRGEQLILLDRALSPRAQVEVLVDELAGCPLDGLYLSPAARALLERAAGARPAASRSADDAA